MAARAGALHQFLLAVFLLGVVGTGAELLLLGHYEDPWQWAPLAILGLAVVAGTARILRPSPGSLRCLQIVAGLMVASGFVGLALHFKGNAEFEREMVPSLGGLDLIWESVRGATPALAPGAMTYLGLLGWAATMKGRETK